MSKYILIPDSFKGTMSSSEVCKIMAEQISRHDADAEIVSIPVADGGEGSVDCFLEAIGGERIAACVTGPFMGETVDSFYGLLDSGETAVVEMAAAAGLPMVEGRANPLSATTYGVGELIISAIRSGARRVIIGLGGSATNDGGCGAAAALGVRFIGADGKPFIPTGGTLKDIASIDVSGLDPSLSGVGLTAMCDIDNPMCGITGAAHIFGPQKGATPEIVELLDAGLRHLAGIIKRDLDIDVSDVPGAGAAGAMGAGVMAFLGAQLKPGIETVLDAVGFDEELKDADFVLTGEGRIDSQSFGGKVPVGVARRAKLKGVPVIAIVGAIEGDMASAYDEGISAIISINRAAVDFAISRHQSHLNLALTIDTLMRLIKLQK